MSVSNGMHTTMQGKTNKKNEQKIYEERFKSVDKDYFINLGTHPETAKDKNKEGLLLHPNPKNKWNEGNTFLYLDNSIYECPCGITGAPHRLLRNNMRSNREALWH